MEAFAPLCTVVVCLVVQLFHCGNIIFALLLF
jgi:hypothetical protein